MAKIRIIVEEFDEGDTLNLPDDAVNIDSLEPHAVGREYWVEGESIEVIVNG